MTGFGKGEHKYAGGKATVELKAINHRFYELSARLPNHILFLEDKIRSYTNTKIKRGRVNLNLAIEDRHGPNRPLKINKDLAKKYYRVLSGLKKDLGIKENLSLGELILLPEVITSSAADIDTQKIWPHIKAALDSALGKLVKARESEGAVLEKDLLGRIRTIERLMKDIREQAPAVIVRYKKNLQEKISRLTASAAGPAINASAGRLDAGRLETEVAIFAKNCDISEEITRMLAHIKSFRSVVLKGAEAGKQLDFIAQELFREINTTGAKAQDIKIARRVIQIKEQIEKIREQVQNIE